MELKFPYGAKVDQGPNLVFQADAPAGVKVSFAPCPALL